MSTAAILEFPSRPEPATAAERFNQHILHVTFESRDGAHRSAFGGGETVAEAVAAARGELPDDAEWYVNGWSPVYGE